MTEPVDDDRLEDRLRGYLQRFASYPRPGATAGDAFVPPTAGPRGRLALIAALAVAAICVTGTAAAALVVTLHGGSGGAVSSTAGSSGRSIFIPFAQPAAGSTRDQASAAGPGPKVAAPAAASGQGGVSAFLGQVPTAYPGNYFSCTGGGGSQVANGQVQAQGMATVGSADAAAIEQLTIQVSGSGATNKQAITDAQAREVAVNQALQSAGIPLASITLEPVQIGQNGYYFDSPGQSSTPSATGLIAVSSSDPVQLGTAADAAKRAGGSQVSSYGSYGIQVGTPSDSDIATALSDATTTARAEAAAAAAAAGLHLGKVSGLTTTPPSLCYGGGGERLIVTVTINYSASS